MSLGEIEKIIKALNVLNKYYELVMLLREKHNNYSVSFIGSTIIQEPVFSEIASFLNKPITVEELDENRLFRICKSFKYKNITVCTYEEERI